MNNNAKLNLNGVFGFNKLLVGKVNVESNILDNTSDIDYIYTNVLTSLQNQITATVQNALNGSEVIRGFNTSLTGFQTSLSSLTTKETNDVTTLNGLINTNYTTLDNKYSSAVATLNTNQTGLQTQLTTLSTLVSSNNAFSANNANTFKAIQTFEKGIVVDGGPTNILQNLTIGSISIPRTLTIYSSPTFKSGLMVESGSVSFPNNSINASCISNLPVGLSNQNENTWYQKQTFNQGISIASGLTMVGLLNHYGNTTLGTSSGNTLTVNAASTFNAPATFTQGLTVASTPVSFPNGSISASSISGLLSLSNSNTWERAQTFALGLSVSGGSASFLNDDITLGRTSTSQLTINAAPTFNNGIKINGTIEVPNNSLPITSITGLNTQLSNLQSSLTSQITKEASDVSALQLQINSLPITYVSNTSLTSQLSNYCLQSNYTALKTQADALNKLLTNTQYIDGFGLNWYGSMNVFGSMIVTTNNNYLNVGSLLNALPSTYVSNSSLSQTLNSYATKTYADGKVSLSTDTMATRTSTQIGYQISTTTCLKTPTETFTGVVKLAELSGLTPVGSVWIVETSVQQKADQNLLNYFIEVQEGGTYTSNSGNINGVNIITISQSYNPSPQTAVKQKGTIDSASTVYVVSSANTTNKLVLGGYFTQTTGIAGILLKATRIA